MKFRRFLLSCILSLVTGYCTGISSFFADNQNMSPKGASDISSLYTDALRLEAENQLIRASAQYEKMLKLCAKTENRKMEKNAYEALRRIDKFKSEFSLTKAEFHEMCARLYRDYKRSEFDEWKKRGWIDIRFVDGEMNYSSTNPSNLYHHDITLRPRKEGVTEFDEMLSTFFLDEAALLDETHRKSVTPVTYVNPVDFLYSANVRIEQDDLPPGDTVRAWLPFPLLCAETQDIRIISALPEGTLKRFPDVEAEIGIAYFEIPRPEQGGLSINLNVSFTSWNTHFVIDPDEIEPYDELDDVFLRYIRSEQHIQLTEPLCELSESIVGTETNAYRKARLLYDWVCKNITYNWVWRWRETIFSPFGCASEDVRKRRVGDCLTQSEFYTALCRSVGIPARVCGGRIFQPGLMNDHFWAEVYFPSYGWMPVDVTFSDAVIFAPGLSGKQKRILRDYFFGSLDSYRFCTHRSQVAQPLSPAKLSPRRRASFFTVAELECGGRDIEKCTFTWDCKPVSDVNASKSKGQ